MKTIAIKVGWLLLLGATVFVTGLIAAPGDLDPTFGAGGIVTTDFFGSDNFATAIAVQPDGRIVVAGTAQSSADVDKSDFAVARYLPDGTLDSTFGSAGKVTSDFAGSADLGHAVAIQADGIIVAGEALSGTQKAFALIRYNSDGSIDATFGSDGKVLTTFSDRDSRAYEIVLQPDQKIVLAGDSFHGDPLSDSDFALARYNSEGTLDQSFGSGGLSSAAPIPKESFSGRSGARTLAAAG